MARNLKILDLNILELVNKKKKKIKGIILAGGNGSRLYPLTIGVSKQLLPVYDKPMIYYPMSVLLNANITDILIISTPDHINSFKKIFGNGKKMGIRINYTVQLNPDGIAQCFRLAEDFIADDDVCLILGDNIFYGNNMNNKIDEAKLNLTKKFATIFGVKVDNPNQFGVVDFDKKNKIKAIVEKPLIPKTDIIVSGLYFFPNDVISISKNLKKSDRGEYEITDINNIYISNNRMNLINLDNSTSWLDTGNYDSLINASNFFYKIEIEKGIKVSCVEEISYLKGFINKSNFKKLIFPMRKSNYGRYLYNKYFK